MGLFSPRRQTVYGNDLFVTPLPIRYCRRLQQGKNEERLAVFTTSLSGAGNQIRTDDLVITNDVLYQLSYTSIPADLHSIPHNDVFVKWFCKNILRSSKQVLIAEIFKFTDGCRGYSAVLTPRKPFGFCQGLSRFAIHVYIIPFFFLSCPGLCPQAPHRFLSLQRKASCRMLFHEGQRPSQNRHALRKARLQIPRLHSSG